MTQLSTDPRDWGIAPSPPPSWHMYRSTEDKLNDAFERIHEDGGDVRYVFHKGARDYTIIYTSPVKS
jgi:hypothetical protein